MKPTIAPTLLRLIAAQIIAMVLVSFLAVGMQVQPEAKLFVQGLIASLAGRLLRLPYWWAPVNLLLPFVVVLIASPLMPP